MVNPEIELSSIFALTVALYSTSGCDAGIVNKALADMLLFPCLFSLKVYAVVDEMFLAGEIRETSQSRVLQQLQYLNQLD